VAVAVTDLDRNIEIIQAIVIHKVVINSIAEEVVVILAIILSKMVTIAQVNIDIHNLDYIVVVAIIHSN